MAAEASRTGLPASALVIGSVAPDLPYFVPITVGGRFGTEHVPALSAVRAGLEGYRWTQYGSGVVGAVAVVAWSARWWRRTPPDPGGAPRRPRPLVRGAVVAAGVLGGAVAALRADGLRAAAVTTAGAAAGAVVLVVAVLWHYRAGRARAAR